MLLFCGDFIFRGCFVGNVKDMQINEEIRDSQIRVVDESGAQLGFMSAKEALDVAVSRNLDLVKIAPQAKPPVCRIMNYGKYKFEQTKRDKEARKNQKAMEVKEVRLSLNIDVHDFNTKLKNAIKFLKLKNKVKVLVRFRGREMAHAGLGVNLLKRFHDACSEYGFADKLGKMEGRSMVMIISPKVAGKSSRKSN